MGGNGKGTKKVVLRRREEVMRVELEESGSREGRIRKMVERRGDEESDGK